MTTPTNKSDRLYETPVAWLLGKQLIGGLKGMLLYTAFGAKLDPRDWMTGEEVSLATPEAESKGEFWFDYLSDAGDGTKAMYSIAYLALSNLWINPLANSTELPIVLPADESQRKISSVKTDEFSGKLPRGEFLFFGGDTAYHAAEYMTLVNRVQRPFNYAYEDLRDNKLISDDEPRRPLFGIPGNHDYYDQIDGFRRQFRRPIRKEGPLPPKHSGGSYAQLSIPGFKRVQEASYVALRLPFKWRLWGLDTESASDRHDLNLDRRQQDFFHSISHEGGEFKAPEKLILATCSPSTVFGKIADAHDPKVAKPMKALKVKTPFLPTTLSNLQSTGDDQLDAGQCRLDLSGDVHHYARYWGPKAPTGSAIRKHNKVKQEATATSYASVVSGAGGAFHHPSTTYDNEICEQVLYPPEAVSRTAVSKTLFKFWNVMTGGYVWLAGFMLAFTIYFGVTVPRSSKQFIANLSFVRLLEIEPLESSITPTIVQPGNTAECKSVPPFALWTKLGVVDHDWQPPEGCTVSSPVYIFADTRPWPVDLKIGQSLLWLSLGAILITFYLSVFTKKLFNDASPFDTSGNPDKKLLPIILIIAVLVIVGLLTIQPYRNYFTPFVSSLIVLFSIFAAITAIILNVRYSDYLFRKSFVQIEQKGWRARITGIVDDYLPWLLWLIAIVVVGSGLWFFGKNNLPAYLVSDVVFMVVLLAAVIGIIVLPFKVGADLLYTHSKLVQYGGKTLIGLWHLILQLLVPFLLIRNGNYLTWILAALLILLPIPFAQSLLKNDRRFGLLALWIGYGAVMLAVPWLGSLSNILNFSPSPVFLSTEGWWGLVPSILAGLFGAVICCLWTGWYFAVCFAFNGHNNEVGGTARIENFKEFIRFRLTPDGLTGYVIAVDDVSKIGDSKGEGNVFDGSDLNVKLIDVFHLVPKA